MTSSHKYNAIAALPRHRTGKPTTSRPSCKQAGKQASQSVGIGSRSGPSRSLSLCPRVVAPLQWEQILVAK